MQVSELLWKGWERVGQGLNYSNGIVPFKPQFVIIFFQIIKENTTLGPKKSHDHHNTLTFFCVKLVN